MIVATATMTVHLSVPDTMVALADLELYRQANVKIRSTLQSGPAESGVLVTHRPRPWSLPLLLSRPARITVGRDEMEVAELPSVRPRLMSTRTRLRACPLDAATTRIELRTTLWGRGPLARLLEQTARGRLGEDLRAEAERLTAVLDRPRPIDRATVRPCADPEDSMKVNSHSMLQAVLVGTGAVAVGTGTAVIIRGPDAIPGGGPVPASVDSALRFYAVWWVASGIALIRAAPHAERETTAVQSACAAMFLGGVARLLAARASGRPHPLFQTLAVVELVTAPVIAGWQRSLARASAE